MGRGAERGTGSRSPEGEEGKSRQQAEDRFLNVAFDQVRISMHDSAMILLCHSGQRRQVNWQRSVTIASGKVWSFFLPFCLVFGSLK